MQQEASCVAKWRVMDMKSCLYGHKLFLSPVSQSGTRSAWMCVTGREVQRVLTCSFSVCSRSMGTTCLLKRSSNWSSVCSPHHVLQLYKMHSDVPAKGVIRICVYPGQSLAMEGERKKLEIKITSTCYIVLLVFFKVENVMIKAHNYKC